MKIHIIFAFRSGPYGGGNQFLKALRNEFRRRKIYAPKPEAADIFLLNSFQDARQAAALKRKFPDKKMVHRLDGPIALYRGSDSLFWDKLVFELNEKMAEGTVFQSRFSLEENQKLGLQPADPFEVIGNAADQGIFYPARDRDFDFSGRKIRLISTSWSSNLMKGFDDYRYLDEHLDFGKYEYTFVGRSPFEFKNIKIIPPQPSQEVARMMREHDLYVTASRKDPCSNSLIEALSCGLPAVALNDGGHPEIVGSGGELFESREEIEEKIEQVIGSYDHYAASLPRFNIADIADRYQSFLEKVAAGKEGGRRKAKNISGWDRLRLVALGWLRGF